MGKRSSFTRMKNDFYPTPYKAILPLLSQLNSSVKYIEPCMGEGHLISHLKLHNHKCVHSYDLPIDATLHQYDIDNADYFITNPPWTRTILHPLIDNLRKQLPTWLLLDADWAYTQQASAYLKYCSKIVVVGRVKWIENSKHTGKDNSSWYLFKNEIVKTQFIGK